MSEAHPKSSCKPGGVYGHPAPDTALGWHSACDPNPSTRRSLRVSSPHPGAPPPPSAARAPQGFTIALVVVSTAESSWLTRGLGLEGGTLELFLTQRVDWAFPAEVTEAVRRGPGSVIYRVVFRQVMERFLSGQCGFHHLVCYKQ